MSEHDSSHDELSGSAPPDAPGPGDGTQSAHEEAPGPGTGTGTADAGTQLTGAAQSAANDVAGGIVDFANHAFDVGEAGLIDTLRVVDAAQTGLSNITSVVTSKVTGSDVDLPTIPTADIAGALTGEAQSAANRLLNGLQVLTNEAYDLGEEALHEALLVVDHAQRDLTQLYTKVTGLLAGKLGPSKG